MKRISKSMIKVLACLSIITSVSATSLAATKVTFSLYKGGGTTGDVTYQTRSIEATSKKYYAYCSSSNGNASVLITVPNAPSCTLTGGQSTTITRNASSPSGNMIVSFSLVGGNSISSASGYLEKR